MDSTSLFLGTGHTQHIAHIHPVVLFNIIEHHSRRKPEQENSRVVGALLGNIVGGVVHVLDSFAVPHDETEAVSIDVEHYQTMLALHKKVSSKRQLVGWYATGREVTETSVMIHEFFWKEMNSPPIHITVDTEPRVDQRLSIKAYVCSSLRFEAKQLLTYFHPVQMELVSTEAEKISLDVISKSKDAPPSIKIEDLSNVESSLETLLQKLDCVIAYVEDVTAGRREGDRRVANLLLETLRGLPQHNAASLERAFTDSAQELLMVVYLASLTRAQMVLADKIHAATQHLQPPPTPATAATTTTKEKP